MPWLLHRPLTVASFSRFGLWRKDGPNHPVANQQPAPVANSLKCEVKFKILELDKRTPTGELGSVPFSLL
eukprot:m.284211 g.284211  ORF g.284211 m.284211 type:complete len:70 (+) comp54964_c1_seq22:793-1002(+)